MRYIFLAAACTLGIIAGLLALPPIGEPNARLVAQTTGDRLAVETVGATDPAPTSTTTAAPGRWLTGPDPTAGSADPESAEIDPDLGRSLGLVADVLGETEESTVAPTTTTTATTTTTSSTTTTTTTTTVPDPTATPAPPAADTDAAGVVISANGIVLPVLGVGDDGWRAMTPCGNEVTLAEAVHVAGVDFVLDPGHGGDEIGAVGANGAQEKALNVRIAEIVEWFLEREGYEVLLTRRSDYRIPLRVRADIANALAPKAFVSIHHNGGAVRRQDTPGTELFVDGGNPEARRLGGLLFEEITARLGAFDADWVGTVRNGVSTRLNDDGADLYGIHRYTPGIPSVITEAGYLSNPSEAELYVDNDVQWAHGRAIADALMRWLRTADEGSGYLPDFVDSSSSGTGGFGGCVDPVL